MDSRPKGIPAITLFAEDLAAAKAFDGDVFAVPVKFEDDSSAVFDLGNTLIDLLQASEAPELIDPAPVAAPDAGARAQLTIEVDDVDAVCAELASWGVELLNGPMDRSWGVRTAALRDPAAHVWEIAK